VSADIALHVAMPTNVQQLPFKVRVGIFGRRGEWIPVPDFAAASRVCREFIDSNFLGSEWCGGRIVDVATNKTVAKVSYNGRVWWPDGSEVQVG
jgi:hypothetical protein